MTEQNKQPPAEAGEGAVVLYMARNLHNRSYATSRSKSEAELFLLQSGLKIDGKEAEVIALYTSQTTATKAAVAAAMRKFAEVLLAEIKANYGTASVSDGPLWRYIVDNSIPAEATAALEKICMEVALDVRGLALEKDRTIHSRDLRAIVTSVIEKGK